MVWTHVHTRSLATAAEIKPQRHANRAIAAVMMIIKFLAVHWWPAPGMAHGAQAGARTPSRSPAHQTDTIVVTMYRVCTTAWPPPGGKNVHGGGIRSGSVQPERPGASCSTAQCSFGRERRQAEQAGVVTCCSAWNLQHMTCMQVVGLCTPRRGRGSRTKRPSLGGVTT